MRINRINTTGYNSASFGVKVSASLQKQLLKEAQQKGINNAGEIKYMISKVENWGNKDTLLDFGHSVSDASKYIIMRNPKISKRVFLTVAQGTDAYDALSTLSEKDIRCGEKELLETICMFDN